MAALVRDGNSYYLEYNLKTLKQCENALETSILALLSKNGGFLTISQIEIFIGYGLMKEEGGKVPPRDGMNYADDWIKELGYNEVLTLIAEALERDGGFFLKTPNLG